MAEGIDALTRLSEADLQAFARTELANWQASQAGHFRRQLAQAPALQSANWQQYLERGSRRGHHRLTADTKLG
jgi:hypothetical protein